MPGRALAKRQRWFCKRYRKRPAEELSLPAPHKRVFIRPISYFMLKKQKTKTKNRRESSLWARARAKYLRAILTSSSGVTVTLREAKNLLDVPRPRGRSSGYVEIHLMLSASLPRNTRTISNSVPVSLCPQPFLSCRCPCSLSSAAP